MNIFVVSLVWGTFCHEMDVKKFSQRPICDTMMAVRTKSVPGEEKSGIKECVMTVKECYDMLETRDLAFNFSWKSALHLSPHSIYTSGHGNRLYLLITS